MREGWDELDRRAEDEVLSVEEDGREEVVVLNVEDGFEVVAELEMRDEDEVARDEDCVLDLELDFEEDIFDEIFEDELDFEELDGLCDWLLLVALVEEDEDWSDVIVARGWMMDVEIGLLLARLVVGNDALADGDDCSSEVL